MVNRDNITTFENIKHIDDYGNEYWFARELQIALEYKEWRKFNGVIEKAKSACENSNNIVLDHFVEADKMVEIGSNTSRIISDYKLSRYACYLIVQNGDSRKKVIALGQTYFTVQTRKQELSELEYDNWPEIEKRFKHKKYNKARKLYVTKSCQRSGG